MNTSCCIIEFPYFFIMNSSCFYPNNRCKGFSKYNYINYMYILGRLWFSFYESLSHDFFIENYKFGLVTMQDRQLEVCYIANRRLRGRRLYLGSSSEESAIRRELWRRRYYLGSSIEEGAISAQAPKKALPRYISARFLFLQFCSGRPTRSHVSRGEWRMLSAGIFFPSLRPGIQNL